MAVRPGPVVICNMPGARLRAPAVPRGICYYFKRLLWPAWSARSTRIEVLGLFYCPVKPGKLNQAQIKYLVRYKMVFAARSALYEYGSLCDT